MMIFLCLALAAAGPLRVPALPGHSSDARSSGLTAAGRTLADVDGQVITHNFDDDSLGPFYPCTVKSPNYAAVENGRVKTYWIESSYDGERMTKGAEFCDAERGVDRALEFRTQKEGWMGFKMNIDETHSRTSDSAVAQVFQFDDTRDVFSWAGLLTLVDGNLGVVHRACMCDSGTTTATIIENVPYGEDLDIVIGFVVSSTDALNGMFEVWVNGEQVYSATGIRFGFGQFNSNDVFEDNSYITLKLGMYNHNQDTYESGEERIIWYDDVTWYNGSDGFSIVDPTGGSSPTPPSFSAPTPVPESTIVEEEEEEE